MKNARRLLSLLLCMAMLLSLLGCQTQTDTTEPTAETTTAPTETTEPPVTEPEELVAYREAIALVEAASELTMRITSTKTTTIAGETYTEESRQILSCSGLGTDAVRYQVEEALSYDNTYSISLNEVYADGTLYLDVEGNQFSGSYTAEEITDWYIPAVFVTADLYGDVTVDGNTLNFTQPTAAESWALPEGAEFIDASGFATLSQSGDLQKVGYQVTYAYGSTEVTLDMSAYVTIEDVTIDTPADPDAYTHLECLEAVYMMYSAVGSLLQADTVYTFSLENTTSQAAGYYKNENNMICSYNVDKTYVVKSETQIYAMDYANNQSEEYDLEATYIDGVYSYIEDGGEPVTVDNVKASVIRDIYDATRAANFIALPYWQEAVGYDLGSLYLVELTLNEEYGNQMQDAVVSSLWNDPNFLKNLGADYANGELTAYMGIDKYTGLPTSVGYYYEGYHTLDGVDYLLSYQLDQSFQSPCLGAYKEITGEMAPEKEPEVPATPLFYHVTGADGQEMWLFGTIHIGDNRTAYLPQEIYDALSASDALAIECDTQTFEEQSEEDEELQEAVSEAYYYDDGTTIQDHIDPELYELALKYMKATGNYNINTDYLKPSLWSNAIDNFFTYQGFLLTSDQGVEERLTKFAAENEIELREVESSLFQIQMMTGYSEDLQELLLAESISYSGETYWESTMELYELWCAGDEATLRERLSDEEDEEFDTSELTEEELAEHQEYLALMEEYNQAMSYDRNDGMLDVLLGYLESGDTVFVAVGLAHLLNDVNGLVDTLRAAGYTVELVEFAN